MPAKTSAIITPFGKEFHRSGIHRMKKYLLLFWKRLLQLCLTVAASYTGRDSEQPTPTHHPGFYRLESRTPPRWPLCLSLSLLSQKLSIARIFWLLVSKGLGNLLKRSCCPGSLRILTANLHPMLTGWTLNVLDVTDTQSSLWAKDPKYVIASVGALNSHNCCHLGTWWSSKDFTLLDVLNLGY